MRGGQVLTLALLCTCIMGCGSTKKPPPEASPRVASAPDSPSVAPSAPEVVERVDWSEFDSTSERNPNDGSLRGGVPLPLRTPGTRFNPSRDPKARFGTVEMVRALVEAGDRVEAALGGLPLTINDLSYAEGGPIPRHRSHQSGRDVDVLFYQLGPNGEPIESVGAFFDPSGAGVDFRELASPSDDLALRLDLPRTWLFLQALIESEEAGLQQIFVAEHIRSLLLDHAKSQKVSATTIERFSQMSCQPSYPHDDHFHIRFFCAPDDIQDGCRDSPPMYPWRRRRLAAQGLRPLPLAAKRPEAMAKIVTHEEARKAAGPMDTEVERWLDRRKQWLEKPRTGRRYCR